MLGVEPKWVVSTVSARSENSLTIQHGLPDDIPFVMPNTGGVTVTPITANHCELSQTVPRFAELMIQVPARRCSCSKADRPSMRVTPPSRALM